MFTKLFLSIFIDKFKNSTIIDGIDTDNCSYLRYRNFYIDLKNIKLDGSIKEIKKTYQEIMPILDQTVEMCDSINYIEYENDMETLTSFMSLLTKKILEEIMMQNNVIVIEIEKKNPLIMDFSQHQN